MGSNLAEQLKDEFRIVGTYHRNVVDRPGLLTIPCDVLKKDAVNRVITTVKADYVIYAVGVSSLTQALKSPKLAEALNSIGAANVCRATERTGSKFVYISSSFVFGGEDVLSKEGDTPMPLTIYGTTVSSAEFFIQRSSINYLIIRTCPLYGWSYARQPGNWFENIQEALAKGESLPADTIVKTGYLDVAIFARILASCLKLNVTNRLLNLSSRDVMSRAEFAQAYTKIFKAESSLIQSVSKSLPVDPGTRKKLSLIPSVFHLDVNNMEALLGAILPTIEESLHYTQKRLE